MWWTLPLRSLWRNRRRTLLSVAIIALGTGLSFFVLAFLESSREQIRTSAVDEYGSLQIASDLLWNDSADGYEYLLSPEEVVTVETLVAADPSYVGSTPQLQFPGLAAFGDRTQPVSVTSLVPENGLLDYNDFIVEGRGLLESDVASVLVGRSLAERLSLELGSILSLTLTTVDGAYNASPLQVVGVYAFASEQVELRSLIVPLRFGQLLLNTQGIDRIVVSLETIDETRDASERIARALATTGRPVVPRTWEELSPIYGQLSSYFNLLFGVLTLAVSVLVFFIILQVLTLAFLERTQEVGTLRALGTSRGEVFRLFLTESAWLAITGSAVGIAAGVGLSLVFNALQIEWLPPGTVEPSVLRAQVHASVALLPFAVGVGATLASSVFPSVRAARLRIVDALRIE